MRQIRVGVIGTGFMGKCHALAWNAVAATFEGEPRPVLGVLCDADAEAARRCAAAWGFTRATTDWRELIADPEIDAVSITTPNNLHREMAVAALAAGKHVWCEKPMATSLADARAMAEAARAAKGVTLLGYNYIRNPALAHARRLIADGVIGRVLDFRGQVDEDYFADPALPWSWRMRAADAGLGTLGDITCHLVAVSRFLIGPVAQLSAVVDTAHRERPLKDDPTRHATVDTDDIAHAVVRFANGATGLLASSRVAHGRKNVIRAEVHGSRGMVVFDQERLNELQLFVAEGPPETRGFRTILTGPQHAPYGRFCPAPGHQLGFNDLKVIEADHFIRCISGEEKPFVGFEDGFEIETTIHAFARSARERAWVDIFSR